MAVHAEQITNANFVVQDAPSRRPGTVDGITATGHTFQTRSS